MLINLLSHLLQTVPYYEQFVLRLADTCHSVLRNADCSLMDDVWSPKVHLQHCQYYKNVWEGKTYNAADARHVDFHEFGGRVP